jgi:hypothetical protein
MATWIVHLRIAENLLGMIPGLDAGQFAVGNIAPDSGIPDEKWEKFTPPGDVTHFRAPKGAVHQLADLEFYRHYLAALPWPGSDAKQYSFLVGYFCHLVTDNLWSVIIGQPTRHHYQAQFEADRNFIWEVKKDWYGLDFVYVRTHPDSLYWRVFLNSEYPVNYLDVLLEQGVRRQLDYIKKYYQRTDDHAEELVNRTRVYLTEAEMDSFVEQATQRIYRTYHQLRENQARTDGFYSALEVF